ncbi:MAG: thioredoxin [Desulfovibrio sp.]|nr:thioredoxin [Desulfovibrio sp.]MDE6734248.1 thioredoxin [Desulfovibrio sp.]MDE7370573.1 thioredoxin [Desulfovibrio sp.]
MVEELTDATFANAMKSDIPVFIDFWAPWCGPCRAMAPIIEEVSKEYEGRVRFYKMNVDENPATPTQYGVRAIPTMVLVKGGDTVEQVTGAITKDALKKMVDSKALPNEGVA